jgi:site-specific DNA-cytosine methylase
MLMDLCSHTAFGAKMKVPSGADIMVAGSSCIDYSALNNSRKEFGVSGESYETLVANVEFAKVHKPLIVILENVRHFPWAQTEKLWHDAGYASKVAFLDTKDFYLPQTRQRGYMVAIRTDLKTLTGDSFDAQAAVVRWFDILGELQRRASSPFTDFLLPDHDRRILKSYQQAEAQLLSGRSGTYAWDACQVECVCYRLYNLLGALKPFTSWENNGTCLVPDFTRRIWLKLLPERVWDTLDINLLRSVGDRDYDMSFKR